MILFSPCNFYLPKKRLFWKKGADYKGLKILAYAVSAHICSKSKKEALEKGVKYVPN